MKKSPKNKRKQTQLLTITSDAIKLKINENCCWVKAPLQLDIAFPEVRVKYHKKYLIFYTVLVAASS